MPINKIARNVLDQVYARLSNDSSGFNQRVAACISDYGLPPYTININWDRLTSFNFLFAQVDPELLEKTSDYQYPLATLYSIESAQTGIQKFNQFSGNVRIIFELFLSYKNVKANRNFEFYACAVEDAVIDVINRKSNQDWSGPVVYNGNITRRTGPLQLAGENWRQRVAFQMLFESHQ